MAGRDEAQAGGGARGRAAGRAVVVDPARTGVRAIPGGRAVAAGAGVGKPPSAGAAPAGCNEVRLVGRVSGRPEERELPSGDSLVAWRVVVDRPATGRRPPAGVRSPTVDTLDCVAWSAGLRRTARGLRDGDVIEVTGALRRRFWRTGAGAVSRTEVEAGRVRRVARRAPAG